MHPTLPPLSAILIASQLYYGASPALAAPREAYVIGATPQLMLAETYQHASDLTQYWVSEKLDGIRARWTGAQLISRGGHVIAAPAWFTQGFPPQPLDGELWLARGQFDALSGAVRSLTPDPKRWRNIRFMIFDLPGHPGNFNQRLTALGTLQAPYLGAIPQRKFTRHTELLAHLNKVTDQGGEGLMLHRGSALYHPGRSDDLLKLKRHQDGEATVIGQLPGNGRLQGMMGALLVEMPNGKRFKIGTGFSDDQRRQPPPVGSVITYKYYGLTANGIPRFASFMRVHSGF